MTTTPTLTPPAPEAEATGTDFRPYRLTSAQYERMVEAGVFNEKDPVFLWQGRLVEKMTKGRRHSYASGKLYELLSRLLPSGWHVEQEQPLALDDASMPEPDLMVVRGRLDDYPDRAPTTRDVGFLVEVADSSLRIDSGTVLKTYARSGIPVYWIVNVPQRRIDVYSAPTGSAYATVAVYGPDEAVPVVLDGVAVGRVAVRDVLP